MTHDPQRRYEDDLGLDPSVDEDSRRGLTGTARASLYEATRDPEDVTVAPDGRPLAEQPRWRRDFAIDVPEDNHLARRDFARFLVLTSGAFVAGQAWIAVQSLVRHRRGPLPRVRIAAQADVPRGAALMFAYPRAHDACLLVRLPDDRLVAYSQKCTHLSCAVIPEVERGLLRCPCHEGYFDLATGNNLSGPPPRPLPRILLEEVGDDIFAVGVETRTSCARPRASRRRRRPSAPTRPIPRGPRARPSA
jgi:nitrite reductase/ring-hydroxylating ferredoxin subunit